jgi:hypothetical protein
MFGLAYSRRFKEKFLRRYFIGGLALKLICGLGFGWVYVYYYGGGDTTMYFKGASLIFKELTTGSNGFDIFFNDQLMGGGSPTAHFMQRIAGILNIPALNSFWACTLLFSTLSFVGQWLLFMSFCRQFPKLHKQLAIAILFIPGVIFWSSGIMKDSICMLFVGVIVYAVQNIFIYNRKKIISALLVVIGFYVLVNLKAYIALALLVSIALYAIVVLKDRIKYTAVKILVLPVASVLIIGAAFLTMNKIGESLQRYSLENIIETAQIYQGYHYRTSIAGRGSETRTGSSYSLGEIDYGNPLSIALKFPAAINVTFFRPFIWEVKNPVMLLSALESTVILIFTLIVFFRAGFRKFFGLIISKKEILFCFSFALIFGFSVGFTTYNFGSLVRYKTPCIPFFLIALVLINEHVMEKKKSLQKKFKFPQSTVRHAKAPFLSE